MLVHILSILPQLLQGTWEGGMLRKARDHDLLDIRLVNIRDYATGKHRVTDDYPFGGGPGMVMKVEPIVRAVEAARADGERLGRKSPRVILMTPQGRLFDQDLARELAGEEHLIFICGRYEGVDERVRELVVTDEISIGDYILTGGELAAAVVVDATVRLIPGVLNQEEAAEQESIVTGLLEGPQYTRPRVFRELAVPEVLLSGNHEEIRRWRLKEALRRTLERRPELLAGRPLTAEEAELLREMGYRAPR